MENIVEKFGLAKHYLGLKKLNFSHSKMHPWFYTLLEITVDNYKQQQPPPIDITVPEKHKTEICAIRLILHGRDI